MHAGDGVSGTLGLDMAIFALMIFPLVLLALLLGMERVERRLVAPDPRLGPPMRLLPGRSS